MGRNKVESTFEYKGMQCVVLGVALGHRCGYVRVENPTEEMISDSYGLDLDVHGGITYGGYSSKYPIVSEKKSFWLGFDCAHYLDGKDMELVKELSDTATYEAMMKMEIMFPTNDRDTVVRTTKYVEQQLKELVDQLTVEHKEEIIMEKYIKDGKVAILVSGGFGAGWSTWNDESYAYDKRIVEKFINICEKYESDEYDLALSDMTDFMKSIGYDGYLGGFEGLAIEWIDQGTPFRINEYDGNESLEIGYSSFSMA